jgi:hypothetical protein
MRADLRVASPAPPIERLRRAELDGPGGAAPALDAVIRPAESSLPALRTVLVAEQDPAVRAMVARTLHLLGYATVSAADGREALTLMSLHAESLALLVAAIPTLESWGHSARRRSPLVIRLAAPSVEHPPPPWGTRVSCVASCRCCCRHSQPSPSR